MLNNGNGPANEDVKQVIVEYDPALRLRQRDGNREHVGELGHVRVHARRGSLTLGQDPH